MEERKCSTGDEPITMTAPNSNDIGAGGGAEAPAKPQVKRVPHLHKLEKKHSSGDLHSRLKTRKLLGVGETDDGDVHRSKLSQILGHNDQLYVRLPPGLRIWQIILAVIFSIMAFWAFVFPIHMFNTVFETEEGKLLQLPIRLYGIALICLALVNWYTINSVDKDMIRLLLLCSMMFFALQTVVTVTTMASHGLLRKMFNGMVGAEVLCALVSGFYYWAMGLKQGTLKRTTSHKEIVDKEQ